jgi:adenylosuccinate lyase
LGAQKLLLSLVGKGFDRQKGYEMVQCHALDAWTNGKSFRQLIEADADIRKHLSQDELNKAFDTSSHLRHVDTLFKRVGI